MNVVDVVPPELAWPDFNNLVQPTLSIADADKSNTGGYQQPL